VKSLVFLEHHEGAVTKASLGVLGKARALGEAAGVVAGENARGIAEGVGGVVYLAEDERLAAPLPAPRVDLLAKVVRDEEFDTVLFAQSVLASDVAAGLAARLDAGLNWDLVDLVDQGGQLVGKRPALADSVWVDAGWTRSPRIAVFRSGTFDPVAIDSEAEVREVAVELEPHSLLAELIEAAVEDTMLRHMPYRGPGLYHIGVRVDSTDTEIERLRAAGVPLLDEIPREGDRMRVAFLHPAAADGVMIELVQRLSAAHKRE